MKAEEFLSEYPLGSIVTRGDFDTRDRSNPAMQAVDGQIDTPSRRLLTGDLIRYFKAFEKTPFVFDFYVVSGKPLQPVSAELQRIIDDRRRTNPNTITIIFTHNVTSIKGYQPMTPWILAHRVAHAAQASVGVLSNRGPYDKLNLLVDDAYRTVMNFYRRPGRRRLPWTRPDLLSFWPLFGTMRSARTGSLSNHLDIMGELIAQYLISGRVVLNKNFPDTFRPRAQDKWARDAVYDRAVPIRQAQATAVELEKEINQAMFEFFESLQGQQISF